MTLYLSTFLPFLRARGPPPSILLTLTNISTAQFPWPLDLVLTENVTLAKGQLISKCLFGVIVWTKIPTKKFPRFLP